MLKIKRENIGFRITSSPRNLNILVKEDEILTTVAHYFGLPPHKHPDSKCPVCRQILKNLAKSEYSHHTEKCDGYENDCQCTSCVDRGFKNEFIGDFFLSASERKSHNKRRSNAT